MVRDNLIEWFVNNKERRLVEEAADILDGLEQLVEEEEMGMNEILLVEAMEIITAVVLAWNLDVERISFVKAGKEEEAFQRDGEQVGRIGRAESMKKMREEISKLHNLRKRTDNREIHEDDFEDLEVKEVTRREKVSRSRKNQPVKAEDVNNSLIQDMFKRMVVVGADVEAL